MNKIDKNSVKKPADIQTKIIKLIAEQLQLKPEKIKPENELIRDLQADSLDIVELVMCVEEAFHLQIPDKEAEKMMSVNHFINYIKKQKS